VKPLFERVKGGNHGTIKKGEFTCDFFGPQNFGGPNKYYDENGTVTDSKFEAAHFYTFSDAKEFADQKKIELSPIIYIGKVDYLQSDLDRMASIKQMRNP